MECLFIQQYPHKSYMQTNRLLFRIAIAKHTKLVFSQRPKVYILFAISGQIWWFSIYLNLYIGQVQVYTMYLSISIGHSRLQKLIGHSIGWRHGKSTARPCSIRKSVLKKLVSIINIRLFDVMIYWGFRSCKQTIQLMVKQYTLKNLIDS